MKKPCAACGKQIPAVALDCVFCNAKQPSDSPSDQVVATHELRSHMTDPTLTIKTEGGSTTDAPSTAPLLGVATRELDVVVARDLSEHAPAANGENAATAAAEKPSEASPQRDIPSATKLTGVMQAVVLPPEYEAEAKAAAEAEARAAAEAAAAAAAASARTATEAQLVDTGEVRAVDGDQSRAAEAGGDAALGDDARPFGGLARTAMGIGGAVMIALFFMPWHGLSSWRLLETLDGADFVRQLFYLTGGVVLLASALLPVPFGFRAFVGATVAATPVMVGAGGILEGWRGVVAGVAVLGLPATHLLRAHAKSSAAARALVLAAVLAVVALYVVPSSSVVPIVAVFKMIGTLELGPAVLGVFILIPLVFAALSLLGLMGRDLTDVGVLLSALSLLWAPVVVALRGLLMEDGTQLYVAIALLWASAIAALSLAQLLSLAARNGPPATA